MAINKPKKNIYIIKGDDENIESFFKAADIFSKVKDLKIQKLECAECDIISKLDAEQRKILSFAKKYGYNHS